MTDPVKVEIVSPIITNTENPWRTQGDYRQDQKRQFDLYVMQAITLLVAVAGLFASSWFQYQASKQPPQKVEVQCIAQQQSQPPPVVGNTNSQSQTRKSTSQPLPQQQVPTQKP